MHPGKIPQWIFFTGLDLTLGEESFPLLAFSSKNWHVSLSSFGEY